MANTLRTTSYDLADAAHLEVSLCERDGSNGLTPGFSVTGAVWEKRGSRPGVTRKYRGAECDFAGAIHDVILEAAPELEPLVQMHLCSPEGVPMHAKANGWYFYSGQAAAFEQDTLTRGKDYGYSRNLLVSDHTRAAQALHLEPEQLPRNLDEAGFEAFVDSLAFTYRKRARQARQLLISLPMTSTENIKKVVGSI